MSLQPSQSADALQSENEGPAENEDRPAAPAEDERRSFTTGIGSMVDPVMDGPVVDDYDTPPLRPTFTARPDGPATVSPVPEPAPAPDDGPAPVDTRPESAATPAPATGPDDGDGLDNTGQPAAASAAGQAPGPRMAWADGNRTQTRPQATADLDEPLLGDVAALRTRWQQVQAGFVDDPQQSVGDAADLIEQTAQALVGALRQRQRQLRMLWERGPVDGPGDVDGEPVSAQDAAGAPDTEHLRLMVQRYRALFNQLCRP